MDAAVIEKILQKATDKIIQTGHTLSPHFSVTSIHKLRVETKRLRAFLRLLAYQHGQPSLQLTSQYKQLYHIAGHIREAQLEQQQLSEWQIDAPLYFKKLQDEIAHYKAEWNSHDIHHILKNQQEKILSHRFTKLDIAALHEFIISHLKQLEHLLNNDPDNEHIHSCRKLVKDMLYVIKLSENEWEAAAELLTGFPLLHLDEAADILGTYNDKRIMLERLTDFIATTDNDKGLPLQTLYNELQNAQPNSKEHTTATMRSLLSTMQHWEHTH